MKAAPLITLVVCLSLGGGSQAAAQDESQGGSEVRPAPTLDLDRLLKPRTTPGVQIHYGGRSRGAWEAKFARARNEVAGLELNLVEAQERYREASSGEWGYSPIGGGMPSDPEVLKIRAEMKRDRQSLEAARKRLRELGVEASLAGVPEEWTLPTSYTDN